MHFALACSPVPVEQRIGVELLDRLHDEPWRGPRPDCSSSTGSSSDTAGQPPLLMNPAPQVRINPYPSWTPVLNRSSAPS